MLLVDHDQAQVVEGHILLEQRVGAKDQLGLTTLDPGQLGRAARALVATGQQHQFDAHGIGQGLQASGMLARENLGRRHHRCLPAGLDRGQHGNQRDQRFAGAHIALQQPHHPGLRRHVARDFGHGAGLCVGGRMSERGQRPVAQRTIARIDPPLSATHMRADQLQGQLVRQQLVISQPLPGRVRFRQGLWPGGLVHHNQRFAPLWPSPPTGRRVG